MQDYGAGIGQLDPEYVRQHFPDAYELYRQLPDTLSRDDILKANQGKHDIKSAREYHWHDMKFEVPPGVFLPGGTSRTIHELLWNGQVQLHERSYLVMGVGVGVEAVIAAKRGAYDVWGVDIHPGSVKATERNFLTLVPDTCTRFRTAISDVFSDVPADLNIDVITFNPPGVSVPISDDEDVIRTTSIGTPILLRFFTEINRKRILKKGGEAIIVLSNTGELKKVVSHALLEGFAPEILKVISYSTADRATDDRTIKAHVISFRL